MEAGVILKRGCITVNKSDPKIKKNNPWEMDREAWRAAIHGVTKSRTRQSD